MGMRSWLCCWAVEEEPIEAPGAILCGKGSGLEEVWAVTQSLVSAAGVGCCTK